MKEQGRAPVLGGHRYRPQGLAKEVIQALSADLLANPSHSPGCASPALAVPIGTGLDHLQQLLSAAPASSN